MYMHTTAHIFIIYLLVYWLPDFSSIRKWEKWTMTTSLRDGVMQRTGGRDFLGEANLALTVINCNCKRSNTVRSGGTYHWRCFKPRIMKLKYIEKSENNKYVLCKPELLNASMSEHTVQRNYVKPARRQTALSVLTHNTAVHSLHTAQC